MTKSIWAAALLAVATGAGAAPASRADLHQADLRVAIAKRAVMTAQASHDPATIAAARAKLKAAQALAWGRRNPAPLPTAIAAP